MSADLIAYFGYGSLVNLESLRTEYVAAYPAKLAGWRRHWQGYAGLEQPQRSLLSIHKEAKSTIGGMLVIDRLEHLAALDERETFYERVSIDETALELLVPSPIFNKIPPANRFVYIALPHEREVAPLLQSYVDVVMAGFLKAHGETGLTDFLQSTIGFQRTIIQDRHQPLYPRAIKLESKTASYFDALLVEAGVEF